MVQTDKKILPCSDKKNPAFIVKYTRKSTSVKSSIITQSVGAGWGNDEYEHGQKKLLE